MVTKNYANWVHAEDNDEAKTLPYPLMKSNDTTCTR
jgi:hypothetical protein